MVELCAFTFLAVSLLYANDRFRRALLIRRSGRSAAADLLARLAGYALLVGVAAAWVSLQGVERASLIGLAVAGLSGMMIVVLGAFRPGAVVCLAFGAILLLI